MTIGIVQLGVTTGGMTTGGMTTGGITTGGVVPVVPLMQAPTQVLGRPDPPFWLLVEFVLDLCDSPIDSTYF
jgi:hypothetical protein